MGNGYVKCVKYQSEAPVRLENTPLRTSFPRERNPQVSFSPSISFFSLPNLDYSFSSSTLKSYWFSKVYGKVPSSGNPSQSALCYSALVLTSELEGVDSPLSALPFPSVAHDLVFEVMERAVVSLRKAPFQIPVSPEY